MYIEEGPADSLIPEIARQLEVALCVIGSVARRGLSAALIGNTAETVLDSLDCDVLVLKPDDIITHLEELAAPPTNAVLDQAIHSWPYSHSPGPDIWSAPQAAISAQQGYGEALSPGVAAQPAGLKIR